MGRWWHSTARVRGTWVQDSNGKGTGDLVQDSNRTRYSSTGETPVAHGMKFWHAGFDIGV